MIRQSLRAGVGLLVGTLLMAACMDSPTAPDPAALISDGANGGNEHFYFLNPVVPAPSPTGTFDGTLEPTVDVCELDGGGTCGAPFVIFNVNAGPGSETVRVNGEQEQYIVNWHTGDLVLDPGATYRISVAVNGEQLGFADVDVVTSGKELKNVSTGELIALKDGRTLPITFRIEEGALAGVPDLDLAASLYHSCALDASGAAYCWGANYLGQLGTGGPRSTPVLSPEAVAGGHTFQSIATGPNTTCGVTAVGEAYCWGNNQFGQIGTGTWAPTAVTTPTRVTGAHIWQAIAPGYNHTCGLTTSGEVYCWGYNGLGELGRGTISYLEFVPAPVAGGQTFASVSSRLDHTCGVTTAGDAYCWGYNQYGQVGNGGFSTHVDVPTLVTGGHTFRSVRVGQFTTCGVTMSGAALCWGQNGWGQLGNGAIAYRETNPVFVTGGHTFESVSAGHLHSCGVTSDSAGFCWGYNYYGQLGNGVGGGGAPAPVAVTGGRLWKFIDAGYYHTCGKTTDGEVFCWGRNTWGALGDGTLTQRNEPVFTMQLTP